MTEFFRTLSAFWCLLHVFILFMFLYRSRLDRRKTILLTVICMGALIAFDLVCLVRLGYERTGQLILLICTIPSLIFFWLMSENRDGRFLFTFCLSDTFTCWIVIVTNLLDFYLGGGRCILMLITRLIAFPLIEWLAWRYLRKWYLELQKYVKNGWLTATVLSIIYYLLMALFTCYPCFITSRPEYMPSMILILVLMPFTYAAVLFTLSQQLVVFHAAEQEGLLNMQNEQLEARLESYESLLRLRHDVKAFRTTLVGLLENKKYEEARLLVLEEEEHSEKTNSDYGINPYINAVLSQYVQLFQDKGIKLKISLQAGNVLLPGKEYSLLLSNALDNALRAVSEFPKEHRDASVQLRQKDDYVLLRVRNTCSSKLVVERGRLPATTKTEFGHGYGLETICRIADSLGGSAVCYTENGYFVLDVHVKNGYPPENRKMENKLKKTQIIGE